MEAYSKGALEERQDRVEPWKCFEDLRKWLTEGESFNLSAGEVETELEARGRELLRLMYQEHFEARGNGDVGPAVVREDGKRLTHKRELPRNLETSFGGVEVRRQGYGQRGESSVFPLDKAAELPKRVYSYPVQKRVSREAVRGPYDEVTATLDEYTGAHVPKRQAREIVEDSAADFEAFYDQRSAEVEQPTGKIVVTSADGKGVPMRKEGLRPETRKRAQKQKLTKRLSKGEKKNRKREALVATVYNTEPYVRTADDIVRELTEDEKTRSKDRPRPEGKRVWASLKKEKEEVFEEVADEAQRRAAPDKIAVFLCDGAPTLKRKAEEVLKPKLEGKFLCFIIILDLIHVLKYLWKAAFAFHGEGSLEAELWVADYLRRILEGKASRAVAAMRRSATCRGLKGSKREAVDDAAQYILNNKQYMRYDEYLAAGLPIASGAIEGTCKNLVKDRYEISGAKWGLEGAEALLKLRAVYKSGDWNEYWKFHIAKDQQRLHPKGQWRPDKQFLRNFTVIQGGRAS